MSEKSVTTNQEIIRAIRMHLYNIGYGTPFRGDYQIGFNDALQRIDWALIDMEKENV